MFVAHEQTTVPFFGERVLTQGDDEDADAFVPMVRPDNVDTSYNSLMVQEDTDDAVIWQHHLGSDGWAAVATVNDPGGESSGITWAADWFGEGAWVLTVQAHSTWVT